jgi:hypothetical protein
MKQWKVKTELTRREIGQILDALAEERDSTGGAPSPLEDRLSALLHDCDRRVAERSKS